MAVRRQNEPAEPRETARLEAFSDGVFAIAVTLLVLNLHVPLRVELKPGQSLRDALGAQWPSYAAYVCSFITILIMWVNHHNVFKIIVRTDHVFLLINGLLLMAITEVPFPTALVAEYLGRSGQITAASVYSGTFVCVAVLYNIFWRYAKYHHRLLSRSTPRAVVRSIDRSYAIALPAYVLAFVLSFINATASLAVIAALALFFAVPRNSGGAEPNAEQAEE